MGSGVGVGGTSSDVSVTSVEVRVVADIFDSLSGVSYKVSAAVALAK